MLSGQRGNKQGDRANFLSICAHAFHRCVFGKYCVKQVIIVFSEIKLVVSGGTGT